MEVVICFKPFGFLLYKETVKTENIFQKQRLNFRTFDHVCNGSERNVTRSQRA